MRPSTALALAFAPLLAGAAPGQSHIGLDLYYFGQRDPGNGATWSDGTAQAGANPLRAEGFDYGALGLDFALALTDTVRLRGNATGGWIVDGGEAPIPDTVVDVVTTASPSLVTLDSQVNVDWRPGGGLWRVAPGFFYHHQKSFFVGGPNLDLSRELFDGNTVLFTNTNLRASIIRQPTWADVRPGEAWRVSFNSLLGWTQFWSRSLLTTLSLRYTRQSGELHSRWNYVGLQDVTGQVVQLVDERLPRVRHRGQVTLRARYSWLVGWAAGLDASLYGDGWGIWHGSAEASLEAPLPGQARLRAWYRLSGQSATRFFVTEPRNLGDYFTQDSDLGDFVTHSPGVLMSVPLEGRGLAWELRASVYGLYRTDRLFALGGHAGVSASW